MTVRNHSARRAARTAALLFALLVPLAAFSQDSSDATTAAKEQAAVALGRTLFLERNFTNPAADYGSSCHECHVDGSISQDRPDRRFADSTALSLTADKGTTDFNTPTLIDASAPWGWVGQHQDLEVYLVDKLLGPYNGWKPTDRARAAEALHFTLGNEAGEDDETPYADRFRAIYGIEIADLPPEDALLYAGRALTSYLSTLRSSQTSRWDAFAEQNRLRTGPNEGQSAADYAYFLDSRIGNQEGRRLIKRPEGFSELAYRGFRTFFRTFADQLAPQPGGVGQCVLCHTPPLFRDGRSHVTRTADDGQSGAVAIKTPGLRNSGGTDPYLHDGSAASLREVVARKLATARAARGGSAPGVAKEFAAMELVDEDVDALVTFLEQLDDVGEERFRYYLIHLDEDP